MRAPGLPDEMIFSGSAPDAGVASQPDPAVAAIAEVEARPSHLRREREFASEFIAGFWTASGTMSIECLFSPISELGKICCFRIDYPLSPRASSPRPSPPLVMEERVAEGRVRRCQGTGEVYPRKCPDLTGPC